VTPEPLVDTFGRVHRDLRIAVTDRCNFRCTYCMPEEGMQWLPRTELLSYEEIERIARVLVEQFGITSIRITGGEPTVRAHLSVLVEKLARLRVDLALTTNGATLRLLAHDLAAAGLDRVNVSLDTLRRDRFHAITKRDELFSVLDGIDAAIDSGLRPVKVNCVVVRGVNDDEVIDFATFGRERGVQVRFIEFMPLDAQAAWTNDQVVGRDEIITTISRRYPLRALGTSGSEPAQRFEYVDGLGQIGVIPTVTHAFCDSCDRIRLTAEGQVRNCLFATSDFDMRELLRSGADDDELAAAMRRAIAAKRAGHLVNQPLFIRPARSMSQIGG
jgi:cyclic pyranopterin phosphate synthase